MHRSDSTQSCQVELVEFIESFPRSPSPTADAIQWGGGGVVAEFFRILQQPTRFSAGGKYDKNSHFLRTNNLPIKFPSNSLNSVRLFYISVRPGDHAPFLETHGNSVRLGVCSMVKYEDNAWTNMRSEFLYQVTKLFR